MTTRYAYVDENYRELYFKVREDLPDGTKNVWFDPPGYKGRRVLYNLPELGNASTVVVVEGEKCADAGNQLKLPGVVFTTSGSSNSWKRDFAEALKGKRVVVIPDNDEPGCAYLKSVADSLEKCETLSLHSSVDGYDLADWLKDGHTASELAAMLDYETQEWVKVTELKESVGPSIFIEASELKDEVNQVDWLIKDCVEVGCNGLLYADPKMAKSWISGSMALHIASGRTWFGHPVPGAKRVCLISREDAAPMTIRRLKQMELGYGISGQNLFVATRDKLLDARLDDDKYVEKISGHIQDIGASVVIWDVFNRFHGADENDNTAIRKVLDKLDYLTAKAGCQHILVHHTGKDPKSRRPRGASCIDGWAEFRMRVTWSNQAAGVRTIYVDGKSTSDAKPINFTVRATSNGGIILGEVTHY